MKRNLVILSLAIVSVTLSLAQEETTDTPEVLTTKRGVPILPKMGDWAIGIDATPMFRYVGNIFSMAGNTYDPDFGFTAQTPGSISFKYMSSSKTAYRGSLLIGVTTEFYKEPNTTDADEMDKATVSALSLGLIGGIENRSISLGRLVGLYGFQAGIIKTPYTSYYNGEEYVGKLSYKDGVESDYDFKEVGGNTWSLLAGGFVGIEFYFAPKMSLAGEFGYDLMLSKKGDRVTKPAVGDDVTEEYGNTAITLQPSASGNLILLFYF